MGNTNKLGVYEYWENISKILSLLCKILLTAPGITLQWFRHEDILEDRRTSNTPALQIKSFGAHVTALGTAQ